MQNRVRSACLFLIAILIGVAPTVGDIKSQTLFRCCIAVSILLGIIAIVTLDPVYVLIFGKRRKSPRVEQYPVRDALNFKITNETVKAGLGGIELRLNRLLQWDGHRNEFMPVNGCHPLVLYANQIDLPYRITRMFQLLDITKRQSPKVHGRLDGAEHWHPLGGYGTWHAELDLLYGGGHHTFECYIQWTERSGPEFIPKWPP
jgi:hypothetical protein